MKPKQNALEIALDRNRHERKLEEKKKNNTSSYTEQRREELVSWLLTFQQGRELWHMFICNAPVLKQNAMTGNAQSYFILGAQANARQLSDYTKEHHFERWLEMETEAHKRMKEMEHMEEDYVKRNS